MEKLHAVTKNVACRAICKDFQENFVATVNTLFGLSVLNEGVVVSVIQCMYRSLCS
jgi:hypothetical protein